MATDIIKKSPSSRTVKILVAILKRFHYIIYFVFVTVCLSVAVILINEVLTNGSSSTSTSGTNSSTSSSSRTNTDNPNISSPATTIDQATLDRIQSLHASSATNSLPSLPSGRINPFGE